MLTKRIIPCLDVTAGRVVKGVSFVNLRDAGDPVELAALYNAEGADELVFLDITASSDERETMVDVVERTADRVFIPLTVGGGIRTVEDMRRMLRAGADKTGVNSAAVPTRPWSRAARRRLAASASSWRSTPSAAPTGDGWEVYTHGGRRPTGIDAVEWAARVDRAGRGRDPADEHGRRRHPGRVRPGADGGNLGGGAHSRNRLGRGGQAGTPAGGGHRRAGRRRAGGVDLPLRHLPRRGRQAVPRGARACPIRG